MSTRISGGAVKCVEIGKNTKGEIRMVVGERSNRMGSFITWGLPTFCFTMKSGFFEKKDRIPFFFFGVMA